MSGEWLGRDLADEVPGELRTEAPDLLAPIDENAPVSGHEPPPETAVSRASAPEYDWAAAQGRVFPLLRPAGTEGIRAEEIAEVSLENIVSNTDPIVSRGPVGLSVVYAMAAEGFAVLVDVEHLHSWGVDGTRLHDAAMANLAAWSTDAEWTEEETDDRRLLSSSTGDGYDAARALLPTARARIAALADGAPAGSRVLVGLPERDLLVAGLLVPGDAEFAELFGEFLAEQMAAAVEPIDSRVYELRGTELVEFTG